MNLSYLPTRNPYQQASQLRVFAALYQWRDAMARRLDEGLGMVMSNAMLFAIAQDPPHHHPEIQHAPPSRNSMCVCVGEG